MRGEAKHNPPLASLCILLVCPPPANSYARPAGKVYFQDLYSISTFDPATGTYEQGGVVSKGHSQDMSRCKSSAANGVDINTAPCMIFGFTVDPVNDVVYYTFRPDKVSGQFQIRRIGTDGTDDSLIYSKVNGTTPPLRS